MKNAAFKLVQNVVICVHNARNPNKQEWDEYLTMSYALKDAMGGDATNYRQIIFTDGGGPNAAQRLASTEVAKGGTNSHKSKVALVSRSVAARGIVTAYRWLGFPMRAFSPEKLDESFAFLAVSDAVAMDLCTAVEELCATIDGPVRSAARVDAYRTKLRRAAAS